MTADPAFVVTAERALPDPVGWALAHPGLLGVGFELVAAKARLPDGREIAALGIDREGTPTILSVVDGPEDAAISRLAGLASVVGRAGEWLRREYPRWTWQTPPVPRFVVLAAAFTPHFLDAARGLAAAGVILLRVRRLEGADGSRMVLVERQDPGNAPVPAGSPATRLSAEEDAFFRALEAERRTLKSP